MAEDFTAKQCQQLYRPLQIVNLNFSVERPNFRRKFYIIKGILYFWLVLEEFFVDLNLQGLLFEKISIFILVSLFEGFLLLFIHQYLHFLVIIQC